MNIGSMAISRGILKKDQLKGQVALITGAGGGIGFEAARALMWLGAKVVIAEINKDKGKNAQEELAKEFGADNVMFTPTDIGNEKSVKRLAHKIYKAFGKLDILINNATITPMGAVHQVEIDKWDLSYRVNLRGPVLLIAEFLPDMLKRNSGVIVLVPSSGAAPYMGAYEVFKTSQVELANTLTAELEETGVITYSIGPGIVKTETAQKAIQEIAPLYGKSVDEFYKMSENVLLSAEEAGAGFAASVALAEKYRGLEIGSIQALMDAGISMDNEKVSDIWALSEEEKDHVLGLFYEIRSTFIEQVDGWSSRPVFERQWMMRDFKKNMGAAPEYFLESLKEFEGAVRAKEITAQALERLPMDKIYSYYQHQMDLMKGYEKDSEKVREYSQVIRGWLEAIDNFQESMEALQSKNSEGKEESV